MVKGISKQVVIVRPPADSMFDQAIFILKEDALSSSSVDAENVLHEACVVADNYVRSHCGARPRRRKSKLPALLIGGAVFIALIVPLFIFII